MYIPALGLCVKTDAVLRNGFLICVCVTALPQTRRLLLRIRRFFSKKRAGFASTKDSETVLCVDLPKLQLQMYNFQNFASGASGMRCSKGNDIFPLMGIISHMHTQDAYRIARSIVTKIS